MSITPMGSNPTYTIIGNTPILPKNQDPHNLVTLIVLSQGSRFQRTEYFEKVIRMGWAEVISLENPNPSYDLETLTNRFTGLRCMVFHHSVLAPGVQINSAIRETRTPFCFVVWSTMMPLAISSKQLDEICNQKHAVITAPLLRNAKGETFPSVSIPAHFQQGLKTLWVPPGGDNKRTLFPFQYAGLYRKDLFLSVLGYDQEIQSPYWQKMDLGLRSYLWGMDIPVSYGLRIQLLNDPEPEDASPHSGSFRFYLKNLAVDFINDHGELAWKGFWEFARRSGQGLLSSFILFKSIRAWVKIHSFRFTCDARKLVELWDEDGLP